jgi:molybdopterin-binding protein
MKGKIINIEEGGFNDIVTIKLDSGNVIESRGFNIGQKGVAMFKIGDVVTCDAHWNDLSKCHYAKNVQLIKLD